MPLKFECNQDPRKMKTVKGAKFCELCQKNVYDMRRKPVSKIVALKKKLGECCMIMYEDQLDQADRFFIEEKSKEKKDPAKKRSSSLPFAAGVAALSLLPQISNSQTTSGAQIVQSERESKEKNKKIVIPEENKTIQFNGLIDKSPKLIGKKHKLIFGFYDETHTFVIVKTFKSRSDGSFSFELTKEEQQAMKGKRAEFYSGKYIIYSSGFDLEKTKEAIIIKIQKHFRSRGRSMGGAYA